MLAVAFHMDAEEVKLLMDLFRGRLGETMLLFLIQ